MTAARTPVLDTLADLTAISLERCALPPRELMLARIAALIAVDAPPASYMANAGAAADDRRRRRLERHAPVLRRSRPAHLRSRHRNKPI